MFFEDEGSYDDYAEFKEYTEIIIFGYWGIAMRTGSPQRIKIWQGGWRSAHSEQRSSKDCLFVKKSPTSPYELRGSRITRRDHPKGARSCP